MTPNLVKENDVLLAKSSDGNLVRVLVKEKRDDRARVNLLDYGRTIVSFNKIIKISVGCFFN